MGWNYRVIKDIIDNGTVYTIREVYYYEDGEPHSTTLEPCYPMGESIEELTQDAESMMKALGKPILDLKMFENKPIERDME